MRLRGNLNQFFPNTVVGATIICSRAFLRYDFKMLLIHFGIVRSKSLMLTPVASKAALWMALAMMVK